MGNEGKDLYIKNLTNANFVDILYNKFIVDDFPVIFKSLKSKKNLQIRENSFCFKDNFHLPSKIKKIVMENNKITRENSNEFEEN